MTPFYKVIDTDGNIPGFGTNGPDLKEYEGLEEITKEEYQELLAMMKSRPDSAKAPTGYDYILRNKPLEWIQIEIKKK